MKTHKFKLKGWLQKQKGISVEDNIDDEYCYLDEEEMVEREAAEYIWRVTPQK